ncbi:MAG: hypothetical protein GF313_07255 [Caldithrix sp.]|nr:hypothetical protein [Caldithrix sp.]
MRFFSGIILFVILVATQVKAGGSIFEASNTGFGIYSPRYSAAGLGSSYEVASNDSLKLNFMNYAQWADIRITRYGVKGNSRIAMSSNQTGDNFFNKSTQFQGAFLALPLLKKKWALGAAVQPIYSVDQHLETNVQGPNEELIQSLYVHGGLSRVLLNTSYKIRPSFSVALGYEYTFGSISDNYRLIPTGTTVANIAFTYDYRFYGHGAVLSSLYSPNKNWNFGLVLRPQVTLTGKGVAEEITSQTLINESEVKKYRIPAQYQIGAQYHLNRRWKTGLDVLYQDWQNGYSIDNKNQSEFATSFRAGIGMEKSTSPKTYTDMLDKMSYRFGLFMGQLNVESNDNTINEYGVSLGFSVPIFRFRSRMDFATQFGFRGDLANNNYEEKFAELNITIHASELWFVNIEN